MESLCSQELYSREGSNVRPAGGRRGEFSGRKFKAGSSSQRRLRSNSKGSAESFLAELLPRGRGAVNQQWQDSIYFFDTCRVFGQESIFDICAILRGAARRYFDIYVFCATTGPARQPTMVGADIFLRYLQGFRGRIYRRHLSSGIYRYLQENSLTWIKSLRIIMIDIRYSFRYLQSRCRYFDIIDICRVMDRSYHCWLASGTYSCAKKHIYQNIDALRLQISTKYRRYIFPRKPCKYRENISNPAIVGCPGDLSLCLLANFSKFGEGFQTSKRNGPCC